MFRSIVGFAIGLAMTLLVWAAFGFVIYVGLRVISPGTAAKVRELILGRPGDRS